MTIEGFDYEVDSYSIVDGQHTDQFELAGGTVVLRGRVGATAATATVSAANLPQALGHALVVLLGEPAGTAAEVRVTGYVDGETGTLMRVDREEVP